MKDKETKYEEAVERNVANAQRAKAKGHSKYKGMTLAAVKMALGIKKQDLGHDDAVKSLIGD